MKKVWKRNEEIKWRIISVQSVIRRSIGNWGKFIFIRFSFFSSSVFQGINSHRAYVLNECSLIGLPGDLAIVCLSNVLYLQGWGVYSQWRSVCPYSCQLVYLSAFSKIKAGYGIWPNIPNSGIGIWPKVMVGFRILVPPPPSSSSLYNYNTSQAALSAGEIKVLSILCVLGRRRQNFAPTAPNRPLQKGHTMDGYSANILIKNDF